MDEAVLERVAFRVAGASLPALDPVYELESLIGECRAAMSDIASGVREGRLSEEAMLAFRGRLDERARAACESLRSCKNEMESLLPRRDPGSPAARGRAPR